MKKVYTTLILSCTDGSQSLANLIFRREFGGIKLNFRFGLQRGCQGEVLIDADSTATFSRTSNIQHRPSRASSNSVKFCRTFFTCLSITLYVHRTRTLYELQLIDVNF